MRSAYRGRLPVRRLGFASTAGADPGELSSNMRQTLDPSPQDERATDPVEPGPTARAETDEQSPSVKLSYLPSLDGLRAVAVMAVLIYHSDIGWLPGGYLGVEVFFVISGYLITSLLLAERQGTGTVNLRGFWIRRARRLLPALYLLLFVVSAWWLVFLRPRGARDPRRRPRRAHLRHELVADLLRPVVLRQAGRPSPFRHLWSLAVEEQFYLVWPLVFVAGMRLLKGRRNWLFGCTLAGACLSAVLMYVLFNPSADPSRAYYGTDTRASGLLLGAALAFGSSLADQGPNRPPGTVCHRRCRSCRDALAAVVLPASERVRPLRLHPWLLPARPAHGRDHSRHRPSGGIGVASPAVA